jgi:5-methylcytosine-specific restriction enzyme subunit McrC
MSPIPIKNLYFLLCYAWDILDFEELKNTTLDDYDDPSDLLTWVFINHSKKQIRRGLCREYHLLTAELSGIKGKLEFTQSIRSNSFSRAKAVCAFDEFSVDNDINRVIKATAYRLLRRKQIAIALKKDLFWVYSKLDQVTLVELSASSFSRIRLNRNNLSYQFLLNICQLVFNNSVLDDRSGNLKFMDFFRDEGKMPMLFESFVRNFYKHNLKQCSVSRQNINWVAESLGGSLSLLPQMQTDTTLVFSERKIIIDTKYYKEALNKRFGTLKFSSNNLYQLHAYLISTAYKSTDKLDSEAEGILLYPGVDYNFKERYNINGHVMTLATIDLNQDWRNIHADLISLAS